MSVLEVDPAWFGNGIGAGGVPSGSALIGGWQMGCTESSDLKCVDGTAQQAASEHEAGVEENPATCPRGSDPEVVVAGVQTLLGRLSSVHFSSTRSSSGMRRSRLCSVFGAEDGDGPVPHRSLYPARIVDTPPTNLCWLN